jgi:hypothetical protein
VSGGIWGALSCFSYIGAGEGDVAQMEVISSIFPSTYSITDEGMVGVTALVAATAVLFKFRFCFLAPVALCAID